VLLAFLARCDTNRWRIRFHRRDHIDINSAFLKCSVTIDRRKHESCQHHPPTAPPIYRSTDHPDTSLRHRPILRILQRLRHPLLQHLQQHHLHRFLHPSLPHIPRNVPGHVRTQGSHELQSPLPMPRDSVGMHQQRGGVLELRQSHHVRGVCQLREPDELFGLRDDARVRVELLSDGRFRG